MKSSNILLTLALAGSLATAPAFAANITIQDNDPTTGGVFAGGINTIPGVVEDNEVETGAAHGQAWDMEGFFINGSTLSMVGGYSLTNGQTHSGYIYKPGDLFIKIGGGSPSPAPDPSGTGVVNGTIPNYGGYTFVVDLTYGGPAQGIGASQGSANVYLLDGASVLDSVTYDWMGSNPWRYSSGGTLVASTAISYTTGLSNAAVGFAGGYHNKLDVSMNFLYNLGYIDENYADVVWFSYTMECGNDSLKGQWNDGFDRISDSASTLGLLGLGLAALAGLSRRRRS